MKPIIDEYIALKKKYADGGSSPRGVPKRTGGEGGVDIVDHSEINI